LNAKRITRAILAGLLLAASTGVARADQTNVAVAANFTDAAKEIAAAFRQKTGHVAVLSFGSSGQLLAQITQEAPFQIMLSADEERPRKLVEDGFAVPESRFTYAIGKLVLWSRDANAVTGAETLEHGKFRKLSIAAPASAPYGTATIESMRALGVYEALKPKIVEGASIAQAFQFIDTGNAEIGFVSLSQIAGRAGSRWLVDQSLYTPIRQDAVQLKKGAQNPAATAFMAFLKESEARAIIEKFGYALDEKR
jgi:molybdate transport system substrate-binding protein